MIIGNGLLANAFMDGFKDRSDIIIFASGVSNSQELDATAFLREKNLLEKVLVGDKKLVYFSTCSLLDSELSRSVYVMHKRFMEMLVEKVPNYTIFRLPQIVGNTPNTNTLTNFFHSCIMNGEHFNIWQHARRSIIDVADVVRIVDFFFDGGPLPPDKLTTNIASPISLEAVDLVKIFERVLEKKAVYSVLDRGSYYPVDTDLLTRIAKNVGINFDDTYSERVIRKYYGQ
jgi:hypothetical protein